MDQPVLRPPSAPEVHQPAPDQQPMEVERPPDAAVVEGQPAQQVQSYTEPATSVVEPAHPQSQASPEVDSRAVAEATTVLLQAVESSGESEASFAPGADALETASDGISGADNVTSQLADLEATFAAAANQAGPESD